MRVLVLGGSTFVGRRLTERLLAAGDDVTVLNRGRTTTDLPPEVHRLVADRRDREAMGAALAGRDWDAVYDVSAFVMVVSLDDMRTLTEQLDGHVGRYVFTSSIMAYRPRLGWFPWVESDPTNPDPPTTYGGFKAAVEGLLAERHARTGFPAVSIRPAAIYGPCNNIYDMEAAMFVRLLGNHPVLVPHRGLVVGSYGHVDDLCDAMRLAAVVPAAVGEVFNVTREAVTVNEYVRVLGEAVGREPDVVYVPDHVAAGLDKPAWGHLFGEAHHGALSIEKATRLLGWTPSIELLAGHRLTYEWFVASGLAERATSGALTDELWRASYDLAHEATVADAVRSSR